jgi:hypothetical protein
MDQWKMDGAQFGAPLITTNAGEPCGLRRGNGWGCMAFLCELDPRKKHSPVKWTRGNGLPVKPRARLLPRSARWGTDFRFIFGIFLSVGLVLVFRPPSFLMAPALA